MSDTLQIIQKLYKAARIISKILFVICIVGAVSCVVGLVILLAIHGIDFNGKTIEELIEKNGISMNDTYVAIALGFISCIAETIMLKFAELYFRHELDAGTPFTFEGAEELKKLGIITLIVSAAGSALSGITYSIMQALMHGVKMPSDAMSVSIGFGVMFLVMSLILKYGAELQQADKKPTDEN